MGMKGGFAMTSIRIENLDKSNLDVDIQDEKDGRWASRGVQRVFKGGFFEITGSGQLRVMFNGEKLVTQAPLKSGKKKEEEEPFE